jgi:hypothetical protein
MLIAGEWKHPYDAEEAAYPAGVDRRAKYWPPVRRVDQAYGDRHLVCACPPPEAFAVLSRLCCPARSAFPLASGAPPTSPAHGGSRPPSSLAHPPSRPAPSLVAPSSPLGWVRGDEHCPVAGAPLRLAGGRVRPASAAFAPVGALGRGAALAAAGACG